MAPRRASPLRPAARHKGTGANDGAGLSGERPGADWTRPICLRAIRLVDTRTRPGVPVPGESRLGLRAEPSRQKTWADWPPRAAIRHRCEPSPGAGLDPARGGYPMADGALDVRAGISTQNSVALDLARQLLTPGGGAMDACEAALRSAGTLRRLSGLVESTRVRDLEPLFPRRGPMACRRRRVTFTWCVRCSGMQPWGD